MAGHVFISQSDMTKLYCDAWLLPGDIRPHVTNFWYKHVNANHTYPGLAEVLQALEHRQLPAPDGWGQNANRVISLLPWYFQRPLPYLVNVGGTGVEGATWYAKAAKEFVRLASKEITANDRLTANRAKPLVALPFVGTHHGMGGEIKGEVLRALLGELHACATDYDIDIALVLNNRRAFIAAQKTRRELYTESGKSSPWPELPDNLRNYAEDLAKKARDQ